MAMRALSIFVGLLMAPSIVLAGQAWFSGGEDGWFWYKDPQLVEESPEPPPQPKPPAVERFQERKESVEEAAAADARPAGPPILSAAWLRENQKVYLERALDNPTPENVTAYFLIQRVMMDRAEQFAKVADLVTSTNPLLDENARMPIATVGSQLASRLATNRARKLLGEIAQVGGLVYFYERECPLCELQEPLLTAMERNYDFEVLPVSLDGSPPLTGSWTEYRVDKGEARHLGLQAIPSIYLAIPERNELYPIAAGFVAIDQLEERILLAAVQAELITDEQLYETQPAGPMRSLHLNVPELEWDGEGPPPAEVLIRHLTAWVSEGDGR